MVTTASAQTSSIIDIDLWPEGLPNTNGIDKTQPFDDARQNYKPTLRIFLPDSARTNHKAILCLPGGGYSHLAMQHEGYDWATYYNQLGFTLAVLKYRMPYQHPEVPISDAEEAMRLIRSHAAQWQLDPQAVGIMGSSAGGHLATTLATHSDQRPAFQILFYPVVTFQYATTHQGSRRNLVGDDAPQTLIDLYSNEQQVDSLTPPAIMLLSDDDRLVLPQNSTDYYAALKRHHIPATLHIYPSGGHGWGIRPTFRHHQAMLTDLAEWLSTVK